MKSVKPGRGPSALSAITGLGVAAFGVLWTVMALVGGAGPFALFGVIFVIIAVVQVIYNFKNATSENRYSEFDIVENNEESDPLNEKFGNAGNDVKATVLNSDAKNNYCPFCGAPVSEAFKFCNNCGEKLP